LGGLAKRQGAVGQGSESLKCQESTVDVTGRDGWVRRRRRGARLIVNNGT